MRHMASVPKGFLRYYVLRLLNEKPMSGSEVMQQIENQTEGRWKPSPGSIYPLLAWLEDKGYAREVAKKETGVRRYALTKQGKEFLEEHVRTSRGFQERFRFFAPPMWFLFPQEEARGLREATRRLALAVWNLRGKLQEKYSKRAAKEAQESLEAAAHTIEDIVKKIK